MNSGEFLNEMICLTLPISDQIGNVILVSNNELQTLIITRTHLHLITPSIEFGFKSVLIEIDKHLGLAWSDHTNDYSTITPSSVDRFWRSAVWSPSHLTQIGSTVIAALNTNSDVFIFTPHQNYQTGRWQNVNSINLSQILLDRFFRDPPEPFQVEDGGHQLFLPETFISQSSEAVNRRNRFTSAVLRTQAISLDWSPAYCQRTASLDPKIGEILNDTDFSLLAIGHRRGDLSLWKYQGDGQMDFISFREVCKNGEPINLLAWSQWIIATTVPPHLSRSGNDYLLSHLAITDSKGVVYLLRVYRQIQPSNSNQSPLEGLYIEQEILYHNLTTRSAITNLKWIESDHQPLSLILTRLGEMLVIELPPLLDENGLKDLSALVMVHQVGLPDPDIRLDWSGCTSWAACTGVSIIPVSTHTTSILITLSSGVIFVATLDFKHHTLIIDHHRSYQLSAMMRTKFRKLVASSLDLSINKQDIMTTYGSAVLAQGGLFAWAFEVDAPNRFRYKPENRQALHYCMTSLGDALSPEDELTRVLKHPMPCLRLSPPASLLGTFVNLKTPSPRLLQILEEGLTPPTEPILSSGSSALRRTLYDDEGLDGLRLRVNVSRFLINRARSGAEPNDIGLGLDQCQGLVDVHVMLCRRIASEVLRRILYYFETANTELTRKEERALKRYQHASQSIKEALEPTIPQLLSPDVPSHRLCDSDRLSSGLVDDDEKCPACDGSIGFDNLSIAICEVGHVWDRCLITFEILKSSDIRICLGCGKKACLSNLINQKKTKGHVVEEAEEDERRSLMINDLIKVCGSTGSCMYCGNRWRLN